MSKNSVFLTIYSVEGKNQLKILPFNIMKIDI